MATTYPDKKIAFVLPSLSIGGAEHQTINQINYLVENGNKNIYLIVLSNVIPLAHEIKLPPKFILVIEDNSIATLETAIFKKFPKLVSQTTRFITQNNITDVIAILPMAQIICRMAKAVGLATSGRAFQLNTYYRDVEYQTSPLDTLSKKAFHYINSTFARLFDNRNLFISKAVYECTAQHMPIKDYLILPNSLPIKDISGEAGKNYISQLNLQAHSEYLILIPGRLHAKKGHIIFIEAFNNFIKEVSLSTRDIKVIIAGSGPEQEHLESKVDELGLRQYFYFCGSLENKLLLSLYKAVDLVIIPSTHEGFGNVAIEGLMQKSLMLVSNTGGLSEIIVDEKNGYLFENKNPVDLKNKLNFLFSNRYQSLLNKEKLYQEFLNKYTLESQINKILQFCNLG